MTTLEIIAYYVNLLIMQYKQKPKASATIRALASAAVMPVGSFTNPIDPVLPLAIQNAYNLVGDDVAQGVQLDVLGKYAGVSRVGSGLQGQPITLDDSDFYSLIQFATVLNTSPSDLSSIQKIVNTFFGSNLFVFDFQNMHMGYMIDSSLGTANFAQMIVVQDLLPRPMGVQLASVIYAPHIERFFGFRTYYWATYKNTSFNSYTNYDTTKTWLSYTDALVIE